MNRIIILLIACFLSDSAFGKIEVWEEDIWHKKTPLAYQAYQEKAYADAIVLWEINAQKGVAIANYALGHMYSQGYGTEIDLNLAKNYFLSAVDGGDNFWSVIELLQLQLIGVKITELKLPALEEFYSQELIKLWQEHDWNESLTRINWRTLFYAGLHLTQFRDQDDPVLENVPYSPTIFEFAGLAWVLSDGTYDDYLKEVQEKLDAARETYDLEIYKTTLERVRSAWHADRGSLIVQKQIGQKYSSKESVWYQTPYGLQNLKLASDRGDIESMRDYAIYLFENNQPDIATNLMRKALRRTERFFGEEHYLTYSARDWLGFFHQEGGDYQSASDLALASVFATKDAESISQYARSLLRLGEAVIEVNWNRGFDLIHKAYHFATDRSFNDLTVSDKITAVFLYKWSGAPLIPDLNFESVLNEFLKRNPQNILGLFAGLAFYADTGRYDDANNMLRRLETIDAETMSEFGASVRYPLNKAKYFRSAFVATRELGFFEQYVSSLETAESLVNVLANGDREHFEIYYGLATSSIEHESGGGCEKFLHYEKKAFEVIKILKAKGERLGSTESPGAIWYSQMLRRLLDYGLFYCFPAEIVYQRGFDYAQVLNTSLSAEAVSKFRQRMSAEDLATQRWIKDRQELELKKLRLQTTVLKLIAKPSGDEGNSRQSIEMELVEIEDQLSLLDNKLSLRSRHTPLEEMRHHISLAEVQNSLAPDEALLMLLDLEPEGLHGREYLGKIRLRSLIVTVTRSDVSSHGTIRFLPNNNTRIGHVLPESAAEIAGMLTGDEIVSVNGTRIEKASDWVELVNAIENNSITIKVLRDDESKVFELTKSLYAFPDGQQALILGITPEAFKSNREAVQALLDSATPHPGALAPTFDRALASEFYWDLFDANKKFHILDDISHLYVVADETFRKLPLNLLLTDQFDVNRTSVPPATTPSKTDSRGFTIANEAKTSEISAEVIDYRSAPWLARRFAISNVPSVQSFIQLQQSRTTRDKYATKFVGFGDPVLGGTEKYVATQDNGPLFVRGVVNAGELNKLPPLPDTATELTEIASIVGKESSKVFLGKNATEAKIKQLPLDSVEIISFATHGISGGQSSGIEESGLVLTPPLSPSREDDGLLTSSEIAQLDLNADWVILSACETALGDDFDREGLPTLSNAFFFAGARSILASYWPVWSQNTAELMKIIFEERSTSPEISKAESVRRAMLQMLENATPEFSHPQYWAPFMVIGDAD